MRDYVKWDDQPGSPAAAIESVLRANRIMRRQPQGPVYIVLDVSMQESKLASVPNIPDVTRFAVEADPAPTSNAVEAAVEMLKAAKSPLIMAGRVSRNQSDWDRRSPSRKRWVRVSLPTKGPQRPSRRIIPCIRTI